MFPIEIWENILKRVDPIELTRLRRVCKAWNDIATQLLQCSDAWYGMCKKNIHHRMICQILEHQNLPGIQWRDFDAASGRPEVWARVYQSWRNWPRLPVRSFCVKTLAPFARNAMHESITRVAALSDTIAVCSSKGRTVAYNIDGERIHTKNDRSSIRDVTLWRNHFGDVVVSTATDIGLVEHFDLKHKKSVGRNKGTLLRFDKQIFSSFQCCYSLHNKNVNIWEPIPAATPFAYIHSSHTVDKFGRNVATMYAVRDMLYAWDKNGQIIMCRRECYSRASKVMKIPDELLTAHPSGRIEMPEMSIRSFKIFAPILFACVGKDGQFGFSVTEAEWKIYDDFPKLFAPVTAILFHIGVLALGLNTGEVYLYRIDRTVQLEHMDFKKTTPKKLSLDTVPIESLTTAEHNSTHYLIAATESQVYIVKFSSNI